MKSYDDRDERMTELLRERVAPPADPGYWDALEARIMARLSGNEGSGEWWFAIGTSWMRAGLLAAGIAVLVAAGAFWQTRATEAQVAYDAVIDHPPAASAIADAAPRARTDREETLRYLMAH